VIPHKYSKRSVNKTISKYTWNSVALVTFSGTELERILTNEGNSVVMQHNDLNGLINGPLGVFMRYHIEL
jgi:hypothetical protein